MPGNSRKAVTLGAVFRSRKPVGRLDSQLENSMSGHLELLEQLAVVHLAREQVPVLAGLLSLTLLLAFFGRGCSEDSYGLVSCLEDSGNCALHLLVFLF